MKDYQTGNIRNIAVVAHGGAGKTSLVEAMLFNSGAISRLGKVEEGTTTSDYLSEEIKRRVTTNATLVPVEWQGCKLNIIDTPGYGDFIGEVKSAMRVVDGALFVLCGVAGIEVQTEVIWEIADKANLSRGIFINKLERENANFFQVVDQLQQALGKAIVVCQLPIGSQAGFKGVVDVLTRQTLVFDANGLLETVDIPGDIAEVLDDWHHQLVEVAVENYDVAMMKYLDGEEVSFDEIRQGLKEGINNGKIIPVWCGSAIKNIGVNPLLDWLADYFPSPRVANEQEKGLQALVYKTLADPYVGKLSFARVYSGVMRLDTPVYNLTRRKLEKISQLFLVRGKNQIPVNCVRAGDFVAIPKLQDTFTGDTLGDRGVSEVLAGFDFPRPSLAVAIEPKSKGDEDKLTQALNRLLEEDLTLTLEKNIETKETILKVMGELHLEILLERLGKKFGVGVVSKTPKIPYRETIGVGIKVEGKHKKQSGGHGQYGHVWLELMPLEGVDLEFGEKIFGGAVPKQYIPAVEKGVREAMQEGPLAGYPVVGVKVVLFDGSYHSVDSSELAFKIAAAQGFKKGALQAKPVLLEPVMNLEILVPERFMGDIISDLNSKRGRILGMEPQGNKSIIKAHAPLAELLYYTTDLKSLTQGRAMFTMEFANYEEVPPRLSEKLIATS
ncbi:MAG: elongation factor G [Thermincolia bacterium]